MFFYTGWLEPVTLHPKGALSKAKYVRTQPRSGRHPQVRVLYRPPDGHNTNTYFFKGGFAVRVWL